MGDAVGNPCSGSTISVPKCVSVECGTVIGASELVSTYVVLRCLVIFDKEVSTLVIIVASFLISTPKVSTLVILIANYPRRLLILSD